MAAGIRRTARTTAPGALAGLAALLAACGSGAAGPAACRPAATPAPPQADAPGVAASADRAAARAGGTVTFTVVARGPLRFQAPCDGPLQLIVADASQLSVYAGSATAGAGSPCGAVTLPAGRQAVYGVVWPVDQHLPDGAYSATLALGDRPALTLAVRVGAARVSC